MSATAIVRTLLAANAPVIAVAAATKIIIGAIPLNTVLPALSLQLVSATRRNTVRMSGAGVMVTARVQVTAQTKTGAQRTSLLKLVGTALPNTRGTVGGFSVDSILPDVEGPDFEDVDPVIYMGSRDFIVKFFE